MMIRVRMANDDEDSDDDGEDDGDHQVGYVLLDIGNLASKRREDCQELEHLIKHYLVMKCYLVIKHYPLIINAHHLEDTQVWAHTLWKNTL